LHAHDFRHEIDDGLAGKLRYVHRLYHHDD
jgi:hypothetical protein